MINPFPPVSEAPSVPDQRLKRLLKKHSYTDNHYQIKNFFRKSELVFFRRSASEGEHLQLGLIYSFCEKFVNLVRLGATKSHPGGADRFSANS